MMIRDFIRTATLGGTMFVAGSALAADGDLDLSFGTAGGLARAGTDDAYGWVAMAVQQDGKILTCDAHGVAGPTSYDFFITRFRTDGTLDPAFGTNGTTTIDFDQANDSCSGVAVQPDGKIVVAGAQYFPAPFGPGYAKFAIARLNANGMLDSTFGNGTGKTTVAFDGGSSYASAVALQPDGKIVVAGNAKVGEPANEMDFALARLMPDGSLDPAFGTGGKATAGFYDISSYDYASSIALDRQGRILLVGAANSPASGIARFLGSGQLDSSFGTNGLIELDLSTSARKIILQRDEKIIVAGSVSSGTGANLTTNMAALRLLDDGSPDLTFGTLGTATVSFNLSTTQTNEMAGDVIEQSDGKIVLVGGARYDDTNYSKAVAARLDSAGQLDSSFGSYGKAVFDLGLSTLDSQGFTSVALSDGRIIAAGSAIVSDTSENAMDDVVIRLQGDLIFKHGFD
jgi:uncharacterized delta-60 repeat protein